MILTFKEEQRILQLLEKINSKLPREIQKNAMHLKKGELRSLKSRVRRIKEFLGDIDDEFEKKCPFDRICVSAESSNCNCVVDTGCSGWVFLHTLIERLWFIFSFTNEELDELD